MRSLSGRPDGPDQFEQEGWPGQLARVERWYRRASDVLDPGRRAPEAEIVDFLYAFFQSAYHLRDWLLNSGGASRDEIDALFADSPCLRFCADVCNGSKHFVLDPKRHTTARIGRMLEYVPGGDGQGTRPTALAFQDRGGYVEFVSIGGLIRDCTATWQQFCSTR